MIKKQPKALRAKGTCDIVMADGERNVYVKQASGQMGAADIAKRFQWRWAVTSAFTAKAGRPAACAAADAPK